MSAPATSSTRQPRLPLALRTGRWVGAVVLAVAVWQLAALLVTLPRHGLTITYWLGVGVVLPFWALGAVGGVLLVRGRPAGFRFVSGATGLIMVAGLAPVLLLQGWWRLLFDRAVLICVAGIAALVVLLLAHRLTRRVLPQDAGEPHSPRWWWALILAALAAVQVGCWYSYWQVEAVAGALVEQGVLAYERGRFDEAERAWKTVIDRYPNTPSWGAAVFNSGVALRRQHRYREALDVLSNLIESGLDDRDPSANLMEAYQNYRHRASLEMSACYEGLGDRTSALSYAVLARDRYPYQSWCGTCQQEAGQAMQERIERLARAK